MSDVYTFFPGDGPLLVSVPHDGRDLPADIAADMTEAGRALPDTDWHVARLYEFVKDMGASMIVARYSRYVVDLNRPADDASLYEGQYGTGLCPTKTFDGQDIYSGGPVIDIAQRLEQFWRPYHEQIDQVLNALRVAHGCAFLWDAHSIASQVPALFDGELPVLNVGTFDGRSCSNQCLESVMEVARSSRYEAVADARFKGGFITRHYGDPKNSVHAIQLELAQRAYMDEGDGRFLEEEASQLGDTLRAMLSAFTMRA